MKKIILIVLTMVSFNSMANVFCAANCRLICGLHDETIKIVHSEGKNVQEAYLKLKSNCVLPTERPGCGFVRDAILYNGENQTFDLSKSCLNNEQ